MQLNRKILSPYRDVFRFDRYQKWSARYYALCDEGFNSYVEGTYYSDGYWHWVAKSYDCNVAAFSFNNPEDAKMHLDQELIKSGHILLKNEDDVDKYKVLV